MITAKESDVLYRKQDMLDSLPNYYDESPEANAIMHGNASEVERKKLEAQDLLDQLFVSTATWGLDYWDRVLDLAPAPRLPIDKRRARIVLRLNGTATATIANLTNAINLYLGGNAVRIVEHPRDYSFDVVISTAKEFRFELADINKAINEIKPAHLAHTLHMMISSIINIKGKAYSFKVPFPITNCFKTDEVKGRISRADVRLIGRYYNFDIGLPITNEMMPTGENLINKSTVAISVHTDVYKTRYAYTGGENRAGEVTL